jgi:Type IV secretion-system coupling protein DNA-binding domain
VEYIIIGGVVLFIVSEFVSHNPTLSFIGFLAIASYVIYRTILGSDWLKRFERRSKIAAEERKLDNEAKAIQREWATNPYRPPTPAEFAASVERLYLQNERHIRRPFLDEILRVQTYLYQHSDKIHSRTVSISETSARVNNLIRHCYEGLNAFTNAAPSAILTTAEQERATGRFTTEQTLNQLLRTDTPEIVLAPAYRALAQTLEKSVAKSLVSSSFGPILPFPDLPSESDFSARAMIEDDNLRPSQAEDKWRKLKKAYDKEVLDFEKTLPTMLHSLRYSAYSIFDETILPTEPFTDALTIPTKERFAGTWIIAPSGQGKTNLMWHLIDDDRKTRGTVVIMDSKGTLLNSYRGYKDAVLIDPKTARINPFQIGHGDQSIDFIEYIFSLIAVSMTQKQQSLFYPVLRLVTKVPNGSLDTFKKILILGWRALNLGQYISICDPNTRDFFTLGNPPSFDDPKYKETKQELIWRFDLFLSKPAMQQIFSANTSNIDFFQLLDSGLTILINNNTNDLGVNGAEFLGRFFLALTWMKAITRTEIPDDQKVPVHFYIDEAQTVIANDAKVPTIFDECRSQMIALTVAHQRLNRINSKEVLDTLFNCPVRFASVDNDAAAIAHRFPNLTPQELQLPPHTFACYVRSDIKKPAAIFKVPFFDLSTFPPYIPPMQAPEPAPTSNEAAHPSAPPLPQKKQKPFKKDRKKNVPREDVEDF